METQGEKLKANLPVGDRESQEVASSVKGDKKRFMNNWGQLSDTCEAAAIVAISLGVNLLTSQLDGIDLSGAFSLKRALGLIGSSLVTYAGIRFLLCRWRIAEVFNAFHGVISDAAGNIDNSPLRKKRIYRNFTIGVLGSIVGLVIYLTRGLWG